MSQYEMYLTRFRRVAKMAFQAAALVLVLCIALPARAGDDRAVKSRVAPVYPEIAKRMKISGDVKIVATVDPGGNVTDAKAVSGNRMLGTAAEDAVRRWRFAPGAAVSTVDVSVTFALAQ